MIDAQGSLAESLILLLFLFLLVFLQCSVSDAFDSPTDASRRFRNDKQLVSHDTHSNTYNYKYTFSVEIVPMCKVRDHRPMMSIHQSNCYRMPLGMSNTHARGPLTWSTHVFSQ